MTTVDEAMTNLATMSERKFQRSWRYYKHHRHTVNGGSVNCAEDNSRSNVTNETSTIHGARFVDHAMHRKVNHAHSATVKSTSLPATPCGPVSEMSRLPTVGEWLSRGR